MFFDNSENSLLWALDLVIFNLKAGQNISTELILLLGRSRRFVFAIKWRDQGVTVVLVPSGACCSAVVCDDLEFADRRVELPVGGRVPCR